MSKIRPGKRLLTDSSQPDKSSHHPTTQVPQKPMTDPVWEESFPLTVYLESPNGARAP